MSDNVDRDYTSESPVPPTTHRGDASGADRLIDVDYDNEANLSVAVHANVYRQ